MECSCAQIPYHVPLRLQPGVGGQRGCYKLKAEGEGAQSKGKNWEASFRKSIMSSPIPAPPTSPPSPPARPTRGGEQPSAVLTHQWAAPGLAAPWHLIVLLQSPPLKLQVFKYPLSLLGKVTSNPFPHLACGDGTDLEVGRS